MCIGTLKDMASLTSATPLQQHPHLHLCATNKNGNKGTKEQSNQEDLFSSEANDSADTTSNHSVSSSVSTETHSDTSVSSPVTSSSSSEKGQQGISRNVGSRELPADQHSTTVIQNDPPVVSKANEKAANQQLNECNKISSPLPVQHMCSLETEKNQNSISKEPTSKSSHIFNGRTGDSNQLPTPPTAVHQQSSLPQEAHEHSTFSLCSPEKTSFFHYNLYPNSLIGPSTSYSLPVPTPSSAFFYHPPFQLSSHDSQFTTQDPRLPGVAGSSNIFQTLVPAVYTALPGIAPEAHPIFYAPSNMMMMLMVPQPSIDYTQATQHAIAATVVEHHANQYQRAASSSPSTSGASPYHYYYHQHHHHHHHHHHKTFQPTLDVENNSNKLTVTTCKCLPVEDQSPSTSVVHTNGISNSFLSATSVADCIIEQNSNTNSVVVVENNPSSDGANESDEDDVEDDNEVISDERDRISDQQVAYQSQDLTHREFASPSISSQSQSQTQPQEERQEQAKQVPTTCCSNTSTNTPNSSQPAVIKSVITIKKQQLASSPSPPSSSVHKPNPSNLVSQSFAASPLSMGQLSHAERSELDSKLQHQLQQPNSITREPRQRQNIPVDHYPETGQDTSNTSILSQPQQQHYNTHQLPQQQYYTTSNHYHDRQYPLPVNQQGYYLSARQHQYYTSSVPPPVSRCAANNQQQLLLLQSPALPGLFSYPDYYQHQQQFQQQVLAPRGAGPQVQAYYGCSQLIPTVFSRSHYHLLQQQQQHLLRPFHYTAPSRFPALEAREYLLYQQQLAVPTLHPVVMTPTELAEQHHLMNSQLDEFYQRQIYYANNNHPFHTNNATPNYQVGAFNAVPMHRINKPLDHDPVSLLPIDAQPTLTRQAYGMDKVWRDEFEQIFSQLVPDIYWNLLEVETNPSIRDSPAIIAYKGRYIVVSSSSSNSNPKIFESAEKSPAEEEEELGEQQDELIEEGQDEEAQSKLADVDINKENGEEDEDDRSIDGSSKGDSANSFSLELQVSESISKEEVCDNDICLLEDESDCDSGAQVDSANTSLTNDTSKLDNLSASTINSSSVEAASQVIHSGSVNVRRFPTRFRMFIDSAKVRFCCDHCGHGWTSMKGRVVFWYELFEFVDDSVNHQYEEIVAIEGLLNSNLIGYCAYKLFGQQCDICKIENRFERPMWYPEEVTKVLHNLYNKIGQVYFGFKMPTIDKQRRAGKPKTSHNSSLCQACHGGVCTDRK